MTATTGVRLSAWRFITAFGVVSLLVDLVFEGARAVTGPYLATLGASATLVGLVTGAGEALALVGRLGSGRLADRTRAYWPLTLIGYAVTLATVPLLGVVPALGIACALVIAERGGKAIRSPAKDVLLSHAAAAVAALPSTRRSTRSAPSSARCSSPPFSLPPPATGSPS